MINYVKGELADVRENYVTIDINGLGYEVNMPASSIGKMPQIGKQVKLYTYLQVKEDQVALFGFISKEELEVFKLLITVNGIGPRGAASILSSITPNDLRFAVLAEDTKAIEKIPGIGKKTAGKLILELKDKFKLESVFEERLALHIAEDRKAEDSVSEIREEAVQALTVLGYSPAEALKAVGQIEITENMTSEDVLKLCLRRIM